MAKSSRERMEQDEINVMNMLEQNANNNIDTIAENCGFSRQKVCRIIKDLEQRNIIWGYTAVTDETAKNLKHFLVLVKKNNISLNEDVKQEIISRKIDDYPMDMVQVENIYFTHGIADWIVTFYAPNLIAAKRFVDETFGRLSQYLQEYTIIETMLPIRKQGLKNPRIKALVNNYL